MFYRMTQNKLLIIVILKEFAGGTSVENPLLQGLIYMNTAKRML